MDQIWEKCFALAVESFAAGSMAIAAVITDKENNIISSGRNQVSDNLESVNKIFDNMISHAEINAINNLPDEYKYSRDLTIYTAVEPCPMCMGAISMSRLRKVKIASRDSWAGSTNLCEISPYIANKKIITDFESNFTEKSFTILHISSLIVNFKISNQSAFFRELANIYPEYLSLAKKLSDNEEFINAVKRKDTETIINLIKTEY